MTRVALITGAVAAALAGLLGTACLGRSRPVAGETSDADAGNSDPGGADPGSSPPTVVFDDFNDGSLDGWVTVRGAGWGAADGLLTQRGEWDVGETIIIATDAPLLADSLVQVRALMHNSTPAPWRDIIRVVFRFVDVDNWSAVFVSRQYGVGGVEQWRLGSRSYNEVAYNLPVDTWLTIGALAIGSTAQLLVDGIPIHSWVLPDGSTSGGCGVSTDEVNADFDDFSVQER